jgi:MFS family permease
MIYATSTLSVLVPSELRGRITGLLIMMFSLFGTTLAPTVAASLTDFVFRDPSKLSYSMAVVVGGSLAGALALLRYVLKALAPMRATGLACRRAALRARDRQRDNAARRSILLRGGARSRGRTETVDPAGMRRTSGRYPRGA